MYSMKQRENKTYRRRIMKIGIIGAMEIEVESLKAAMEIKNTVKKASMEFFEGTI